MTETAETQKIVRKLQKENVSSVRKSHSGRLLEVLDETGFLLSEHSLAERPSFSKGTSRAGGVVVESLYSVFTLKPLPKLYLEGSRLSKMGSIHYPSSEETYSRPRGLLRKR